MTNVEKYKSNILNILILICAANYYFIHMLGVNTFSASAFVDKGWGSIFAILFILLTESFALWHLFLSDNWKNKLKWGALVYILQIYALREADFHRTFTSINVTKLKYFLKSNDPTLYKVIAGIILGLFAIAFLYLIISYATLLIKEIFINKTNWAISFCMWGILLAVSIILDKSAINDDYSNLLLKNIEEMLEITAAFYALISISSYTYSQYTYHK